MATIIMELTERNLTKHDERLADIREKRMIDPNSEKFYRIWSWIRDVNENTASGGHLTTPQHSRPGTARQSKGKNGENSEEVETCDDDGVEDLMGNENNARGKQLHRNIPIELLNVTTDSAVRRAEPVDIMYIDEDVRAVDDDDYEPAHNNGTAGRQHTWANLNDKTGHALTPRQSMQPHPPQQGPRQAFVGRSQAVQNIYNYPPQAPAGKIVLVKPANPAPAAVPTTQATPVEPANKPPPPPAATAAVRKSTAVENAFQAFRSSTNAATNAMTPGAFYTALSRAAQRAAQEGHTTQISQVINHVSSTAPAVLGRQPGIASNAAAQATGLTQGERLRSAMSRRTAPPTINSVSSQQGLPPNQGSNSQGTSQVILKLQVSGEQLKPRTLHTMNESRSQASLLSSDPSAGTSKLSLPLMDRIKRLTSKIKPQLKNAFGSSNAVAPSSQSNINMSMDSLARQDSSTFGDEDNYNSNTNLSRTMPAHHVRFTGIPPLDDEDTAVGGERGGNNNSRVSNVAVAKGPSNGSIKTVEASSNPANKQQQQQQQQHGGNVAKRFFQATAQRIYRPFVQQHQRAQPPGRPQDSTAALQVTLV